MIKIPFSLDDWELSISKDEATSMNVKILKDLSRGVSLFSRMWNYMRLKFNGVRMGKHCVIHGHVGINVASTAFFSIGDYFYMSNGRHRNPLCGNVEGGFYLENNARVQIGNYVGMSSTVLWASTSITIGSHVNIGANVKIMDTDAHSLDYAKRRNAPVAICRQEGL